MKILAVAAHYPTPDRSAGDLRFFRMLECLAREHSVSLCAYGTLRRLSDAESGAYRAALCQLGVIVTAQNPIAALRSGRFDAIIFEFYFAATSYLDEARSLQPAARL